MCNECTYVRKDLHLSRFVMGCLPTRPPVPDVCVPPASEGFRLPVPDGYGPPVPDGYADVHVGRYAVSPPINPRKVR